MQVPEKKICSLQHELQAQIGRPVNAISVVAVLESQGFGGMDLAREYGVSSIEELADLLYQRMKFERYEHSSKSGHLFHVSGYLWVQMRLLGTYFPLGIFHLFPVIVQVFTIIAFGYSLWASLGFNVVQATAVVMGVLLGLIISGGYVKLLGKQAGFYWNQGDRKKTLGLILGIFRHAALGYLAFFLIAGIITLVFSLYPLSFQLVAFSYALGIGSLLLVYAPFHTIRKRWFISLGISLATVIALGLDAYTEWHTYLTHWIGMAVGVIIGWAGLLFFFRDLGLAAFRRRSGVNLVKVFAKNYRYFVYGFLVYVFIFLDRIIAWSGETNLRHDFLLLYEKSYEIGMDLAILVFFLLAGVLEYAIAAFSRFMDMLQGKTHAIRYQEYNNYFTRMYHWHLLLLVACGLLATWIIYFIITEPWGYQAAFGETLSALSLKVCIFGGLGYFFLTFGMLNCLYLFTLNASKIPHRALWYACLVNFSFGVLCSRFLGYEYSSLGMLAGSLFFAFYTYRTCRVYFKNLDYHYYAAY